MGWKHTGDDLISYEDFKAKLDAKITSDDDFYYELLVNVIKYPLRYTGIFRLSNAKTKLLQNVTQSHEIKFGDFLEDIVTEYLAIVKYNNIDKNIGADEEGNQLSADQIFEKNSTYYLVEQKIRDDHDSTKKRGQFDNFRKKCLRLKRTYPGSPVIAVMWFIDDSLMKNKKYYEDEIKKNQEENVEMHIAYGGALFTDGLLKHPEVWDELCRHLSNNKSERKEEVLSIPDFDTSPEMRQALNRLQQENPTLLKKLLSDSPQYKQLRMELFPTMSNLSEFQGTAGSKSGASC